MADPTDDYSKIDTINLPGGVGGHGDIVAYDADTKTVWLSQSPDNNVIVIDTKNNTVEATIPDIGNANGIDFSPKYAFVADVTNDSLDVIDKRTFSVVDKVPLTGTTPDGVAYIPSTKQVTVASDDANTLSFINAKAPFTLTSTTQLVPTPSPPGPDVQTYSPQTDRIYQPDDQDIDVINPHTGKITKTFDVLPGSSAIVNVKPPVYDPVSNDLIVGTTNNELLVVNATKGTVFSSIPIKGPVDEGVIDAATRTAFFASNVGSVYAVNLDTDKLVGTIPTEAGTHSLTVDPTNGDLYVYEGNSNTVDVFAQVVCFASGTLIRTARGEVAVEYLAVGDLAETASGAFRPIRWLGHRLIDSRKHPRPNEVMPVRISAHAFGPDRPKHDLCVSPGHSLCVDVGGEVLIPALALGNGATILQEDVDTVTYWHVELDEHDILLAENMPAESYLEMGNRGFFAESGVVALDASPEAPVATHADFCRPFHMEGALVEVVRAQLVARAKTLGWRLEHEELGDIHLLVDGVRVDAAMRGLTARFILAAAARDVWLVSTTSIPAQIAGSPDTRSLGLSIRAITLDDGVGMLVPIALDDPSLCVGFHAIESGWRWTAGKARLPASLWKGMENDFFLRVDVAHPALPRWVAPAARVIEGPATLLTLIA